MMRWIYIALGGGVLCYLTLRVLAGWWLSSQHADIPQVEELKYELMLRALLDRDVPEVGVAQLAKLPSYQRLDARSRPEFEVSHLPHAHWIGYDDFDEARVAHLDKTQTTIIYCSVGYRSEKMVHQLTALGFTDVYNLYGGLFEWVNQGHEVVDASERVTSSVHAYNKLWGIWVRRGIKVY